MKKLLIVATLVGAATASFAQGTVNFQNASTTLISAGGASMPTSATTPFRFALFLAPSGTVAANSAAPALTDPAFQSASVYNVNSPTAVGRLVTLSGVDTGSSLGTADFIVRGWSANAGQTWAEALAFWNNGSPSADMYIGSSRIGDNIVLGGGTTPATILFGVGANQVVGYNMALVPGVIVPEPTSMVLAGLGAASLLLFRRRK